MTSLTHGSALRGRGNGGLAARRRLIRWAWGLFRREWRQQILVIALLTVAVAAAVSSVTVAYNSGPLDYAEFGSASALIELDGADPQRAGAALAAAEKRFGTTDVIGHRSLPVPGGVDTMELRAQDPAGPYARLALRDGSYPVGPNQVAVTDGVAALLGLDVGKTLALDGQRREVVGIVENPRELSDEFALVSPSSAGPPETATVLFDAGVEQVRAFVDGQNGAVVAGSQIRGHYEPAPELAMFSVATVFMLLAALVATAGFAVIARRRLRQLGMLAAIGATEKHLRLVLLANGAVVGAIGGLIGTVAGLALWFTLAPTLEPALDYRLDRSRLPWALFAMTVVVAVLAAIAAAWWPARAVARVPITLALSARPPRPTPAHRSAIVAVVLIAAGACGLVLSGRSTSLLVVAGILATILGTLLLCPLAIRLFARAAGHAPITVRLALRDLARYQARSGAALAAITLALGIAAAVVIVAAAEEKKAAGDPPNLSNRQIRAYTGPSEDPDAVPIQTPVELDRYGGPRSPACGRSGRCDGHSAAERPANRPEVSRLRGRPRPVPDRSQAPGRRAKLPPRCVPLRRHACAAQTPRHRSRDRSTRAPTSWPTRAFRQTSSSFPDLAPTVDDRVEVVRVTNVQRIESQEYLGGHTEDVAPASFITLDGSSPPWLDRDSVRLARRVEPAV